MHIGQLSRHLRERGHDVLVLAPGENPGFQEGARVVGRPVAVRVNGSVAKLCMSARSSQVVRRALEVFRPDVIHVHDPLAPSTSMLGVLHHTAPVVATFHSYFARDHFEGRIYTAVAPLLQPVWRRIQKRIAVSAAARASVCSRMGWHPIEIIPNGADIGRFANAISASLPPGRKLLFVGRLEPRKGFPVAVRAFERLAAEHRDLQLIVVGDGAERSAIDHLSPEIRRRVHMMGRVSDEELPSFHKASDIFISPATGQESFGIVLVEAMAAGLPVVASDIAGYREVTRHGSEGLLVAPSDAESLAAGVRQLLHDPALALTLGAAGSIRARTFSWEQIIDRIEDAYRSTSGSVVRRATSDTERPIPVAVGADNGLMSESVTGRSIHRERDSTQQR